MVELLKVMQQGVINKVSDPQSSFTEAVQRKKKKLRNQGTQQYLSGKKKMLQVLCLIHD